MFIKYRLEVVTGNAAKKYKYSNSNSGKQSMLIEEKYFK